MMKQFSCTLTLNSEFSDEFLNLDFQTEVYFFNVLFLRSLFSEFYVEIWPNPFEEYLALQCHHYFVDILSALQNTNFMFLRL